MVISRPAWWLGVIILLIGVTRCPADETPLFTFQQWSDVHVGNAINEPVHTRLNAAVALANTLQPDFVISSGDMTNNPVYGPTPENLAEYDEYLGYVAPLTMPRYDLPGNHELGYPDATGPPYSTEYEALVAAYQNKLGPLNQSFTHQGFRFILFNNNPRMSGLPGYVYPDTLTWIENELAAGAAQGETPFLFCHVPLLENGTGSPWGTSAEGLVGLAQQYGAAMVGYGHQHESHVTGLNGTQYIMCPDLKVSGHQSINEYTVYNDHFELRQIDVISQESTLLGSYSFTPSTVEPVAPGVPDYAWAFDDGPGATTTVAYKGTVDGQIEGAVDSFSTPFYYPGNRALRFDGSDDRVDLEGISLTSESNSAVTVSAWVYSHDTAETKKGQIFGNWFQGGDKQTVSLIDYTGGGRMMAETDMGPVGTSSSAGIFPRNEWVHLVGVFDGTGTSEGSVSVYVNGVLDNDVATEALLRDLVDEGTYGIGGDAGTIEAQRHFDGIIDEVAVWRSALSTANVKWLHENSITSFDPVQIQQVVPSEPDYAWTFDDGSGATLAVATNGAVNGQIVGAADSANTHFAYDGNRSLEFDGVDDRVDLDGIDLTSEENSAVTVSAWVYSRDTAETKKAQIFGNWFQGGDKQTVSLIDYTGGGRMTAETDIGFIGTSSSEGDFLRNEWVHLVGVMGGTGESDGFVAVYVNGVLADCDFTEGLLRDILDEGFYGIGGDVGTADSQRYFDGLIDEVAVWRSALTEQNILWLYEHSLMDIAYYNDPLEGDANMDKSVDVSDLGILAGNYGTASGMSWGMGDFTGDGAVDVSDLGILAANYGTSVAVAVPEPGVQALLLGTLISFIFYRRQVRQS
ncbi:MAG: metallophosphoesterase [Pirellulales bacterium]|nr:metallophosphoesterase [Pirellulales bacterium]